MNANPNPDLRTALQDSVADHFYFLQSLKGLPLSFALQFKHFSYFRFRTTYGTNENSNAQFSAGD